MNTLKKLWILLFFLMTTISLFAQYKAEFSGAARCAVRKSSLASIGKTPFQSNLAPGHSFDVLKYTLDLDLYNCYLPPYPKNFTGSVKVDFRVDSTLNMIRLNAENSSLIIDSVRMQAVSFIHSGNLLTIQLDNTYQPGDMVSVKIYYRHKNVTDNAFYCSNGFVFTDCEPEGARRWFPCWDKPSDKAKLDLTAKVKSNVKLGSNGYLADSTLNGDYLTYHWVSAQEVATYLVVLTSKVNYQLNIIYWPKLSNPTELVPLRFYFNAGEDPTGVQSIMPAMTDWFSENFIEHPFDKNGFATLNSDFSWGGMENQTLTSLCPNCWDEGLAAHEFAHQWFGDMITCATWADIWLNEGFATWAEPFWYEYTGGYSAYKAAINDNANYYLATNPGWAISDPTWAVNTPSVNVLFNYSITYTKGACVLHQLRYVLGDSLFFNVLQAYCSDTLLKFGSATISDFRDKVNEVTAGDYGWFFDQWIYQPNHPTYQNTYNFENLGNNQWKINFFTKQTQTNTVFFKMPIEVNVRFSDGSDTTFRVMNDINNQSFWWVTGKQPVMVFFDADRQIVLKNASTIVGTGPIQHSGDNQVQIFPNPASQSIRVDFMITTMSSYTIEITSLNGDILYRTNHSNVSPGNHSETIDCQQWKPGTYILSLNTGTQIQHRKIIITR
jgi:aminopeptidase N